MTTRKRKSPEKKGVRRGPGIVSRAAAAFGGFIGRHPSVAGGCAAFAVIFSFVSANALWYQPGEHPSPFFRTRDPRHPDALAGFKPASGVRPQDVTTFRIERPDATATASIDPARTAESMAANAPPSALVMDVQKQLIRRGLYNGVADGMSGPRTAAAVLVFQQAVGMEQTGEATPELLAALKIDGKGASTLPAARPPADVTSKESEADPVAAAIRSAEKKIVTAKDGKAADAKPSGDRPADSDLVMKIQRGLSNIAYSDVSVDGVAGEQTRAAIRHFEKHYRLPETGLPNDKVLKKLKDIGAL